MGLLSFKGVPTADTSFHEKDEKTDAWKVFHHTYDDASDEDAPAPATPVRVVALPRVASSFKPIARAHRAHRDALARRPRAARRPRRFDSHRGNESETNECRAPSPRRFATSTAPPRVDRCVSSVARCPTREVHPSSFSITDLFF
jgi:hypothetical protein